MTEKQSIVTQLGKLLNPEEDVNYRKIFVEIGSSSKSVVGFDTTAIYTGNTSDKDQFFHSHLAKCIPKYSADLLRDRNRRRIELLLRFVNEHKFIWRLDGDQNTGIVTLSLQKPPKILKKSHQQIIGDLKSILKYATGSVNLIVK